jgi:predicted hydrocarbon binding protein
MKASYFSDSYLQLDVNTGVINNTNGTRLLGLSEDFLRGFRRALIDETGEANRLVFHTCGKTWGANLALRLEKELASHYEIPLNQLPMYEFGLLLSEFWMRHGWGELQVNWQEAHTTGVFDITLVSPAFSSAFGETEVFSDDVFTGILEAVFSHFSGQDLACYQTAFETEPVLCSRFVLGLRNRLKQVPDWVQSQKLHTEIVQQLKAVAV